MGLKYKQTNNIYLMKKYVIIILLLAVAGYIGYNFYQQYRRDNDFICKCRKGNEMNTKLMFDFLNDLEILKVKALINNKKINIKRVNITDPLEYNQGFSLQDTLKIVTQSKNYNIYGFKYDSVMINPQKGLECEFKGAFVNDKWNEGNVFILP